MFLDFLISPFKVPKIAKNLRFWCLQTCIPVSANLYTGVCELIYQCLWTCIPVSVNLYTGVCELVHQCHELIYQCLWNCILPIDFVGNSSPGVCKLVYRCLWTCIPVCVNLYTGVCELVYWCMWTRIPVSVNSYRCLELVYRCLWNCILGWEYTISKHRYTSLHTLIHKFADTGIQVCKHRETSSQQNVWAVYNFTNTVIWVHHTGIQVRRHWYTSSQTPVYKFAGTGIRVCRHRYTSLQTPVYKFADTGSAIFFAILGDLKGPCKNYSF